MQLTLLKKDVESFCKELYFIFNNITPIRNSTVLFHFYKGGIQAADLGTISINEIKDALDTTVGKKYAVEVHCEKAKKVNFFLQYTILFSDEISKV